MEKELRLTDLVDVEILQKIQDSFSNMTGIAALTTDADGIAVTRGSKFSEFCMKYTRNSKIGCAHCQQCDKYGAELAWKKGRSITYYCHAGLVDFAAPIMADDKIIGCFIGGQILTEPPKEDKIRAIAEKIGVNPDEYMEAAKNVNIIPKENIDKAAQFLYSIASILSDKRHLNAAYALIFAMPGIPCVYYGSEWGVEGRKEDGDASLRPCIEKPEANELTEFIKKLAEIRKDNKALAYGGYKNIVLTNLQLVFERYLEGETVYVGINIDEKDFKANFSWKNDAVDLLTGEEVDLSSGVNLPPFSVAIWK